MQLIFEKNEKKNDKKGYICLQTHCHARVGVTVDL